MSAHHVTTQPAEPVSAPKTVEPVAGEADRYQGIKQYSLAKILGVWAAAAVPMAVLAWIVAPLLADQLGGDEPLAQALLILLTAGLVWQFVLTLILLRRELGTLQWSRVRDALWLRPPRDPKTGRVGGRVWGWAVVFLLLFGIWAFVPAIPGPSVRDFGEFLGSDRGEDFFRGAWAGLPWRSRLSSSTPRWARSSFSGGCCCRACAACSVGATGSRTGHCSPSITSTCHGSFRAPWSTASPLSPIHRGATRARGIGIIVHSTASVFALIFVLTLVA
jgi:hypothetical protein